MSIEQQAGYFEAPDANAKQVGGTHYKGVAYQHWDLCWDMRMGHLPSAISKYATRHPKKKGREDVEKALHYAEKYLEVIRDVECPFPRICEERQGDDIALYYTPRVAAYVQMVIGRYCEANQLKDEEASIISILVNPHDGAGISKVLELLQAILQRDYPQRYQPDHEDDSAADAAASYVGQDGIGRFGGGSRFDDVRPDHHNPGEGVPAN